MSKQREAFEAWLQKEFGYVDEETLGYRTSWTAWQASRAAALEEAAQEILKHPVMQKVAPEWATHFRKIAFEEQS